MNVVGKFKAHHRQAKKEIEARKKLSVIPESRIKGIGGLPIELWSIVIEYAVVEQLGDLHLQCCEMSKILNSRLVCSVFDKEIQHSLHQHIRLAQLPHLALMRTLIRQSYVQDDWPTFHISLLASAICNSANAPLSRRKHETPRIANRIRNCTTIASHITNTLSTKDLLQCLSIAASTSIYVQEYIYMPSYYEQLFQTSAEGDACLEVALLVVCGYEIDMVVKTMVKLVEIGELEPYAQGKNEWEVRRERRWGDDERGTGRKYGRMDFGFLGGETHLW